MLRAKPLHGAAIVQHVPQLSREELHVEKGSLYPALQKVLRKGWVKLSQQQIWQKTRVDVLNPGAPSASPTQLSCFRNGSLAISDGRLAGVGGEAELRSWCGSALDAEGHFITPGFIDIQVHGGDNADVMDGTLQAFETVVRAHAARDHDHRPDEHRCTARADPPGSSFVGVRMRTPRTNDPFLPPRSSRVAQLPFTTSLACRRDTLGECRQMLASSPRPTVCSPGGSGNSRLPQNSQQIASAWGAPSVITSPVCAIGSIPVPARPRAF